MVYISYKLLHHSLSRELSINLNLPSTTRPCLFMVRTSHRNTLSSVKDVCKLTITRVLVGQVQRHVHLLLHQHEDGRRCSAWNEWPARCARVYWGNNSFVIRKFKFLIISSEPTPGTGPRQSIGCVDVFVEALSTNHQISWLTQGTKSMSAKITEEWCRGPRVWWLIAKIRVGSRVLSLSIKHHVHHHLLRASVCLILNTGHNEMRG